jgi:hypothetical protein
VTTQLGLVPRQCIKPFHALHSLNLTSASASSPSTRYSDSPAMSTPTSLLSHSPGIVQSVKIGPRTRQPNPTKNRPPVTRRKGQDTQLQETLIGRGQGLPILRDSVTSSSSSTVKIADTLDKDVSAKKQRKNLTSFPPSPPPRKSSMKFKSRMKETGQNVPPSRPSREGADDLDIRLSSTLQNNLSPLKVSDHHKRESLERLFTDALARRTPTSNQPIPISSQTRQRSSRHPMQSLGRQTSQLSQSRAHRQRQTRVKDLANFRNEQRPSQRFQCLIKTQSHLAKVRSQVLAMRGTVNMDNGEGKPVSAAQAHEHARRARLLAAHKLLRALKAVLVTEGSLKWMTFSERV